MTAMAPRASAGVDAVFLMAHGGPESLDDVEPFLRRVMKRREPSPDEITTIRERYRRIGGKSPLLERTRQQATALEAELRQQGRALPVYVGMRHWHPSIATTVEQMRQDGIRSIIAISLAPHYSRMSVGAYIQTLHAALERPPHADGNFSSIMAVTVEGWHLQPRLLDAFAKKVMEALNLYPEGLRASVQLLFTAHSLPAQILAEGDPYPQALEESLFGILERLERAGQPPRPWRLAYQSRGLSTQPWLGPDVEAILRETPEGQHLLIVPIGFVCDHVEILYDIDIFYQDIARARKISLHRTESLNADPLFIQALAAVVQSQVSPHG